MRSKIKSFTDLESWRESHKIVLMIYKATKEFPQDERFGLVSQMRRAAISVTSNIAEGFGRATSADKRRFYMTARSSLAELQNQMLASRDLGYISKEVFMDFSNQSIVADKLMAGLEKSAVDRVNT